MKNFTNRQSLGEFLRTRRESLKPEDVGLPTYGNRRTSGLRREEVAQLAHIGVSWYTSLEQGRNVNPSDQVLDSLVSALRLSADERRHLFLLAKSEGAELEAFEEIDAGLERTLSALNPNPAYIVGRYWDLLHWNEAAAYIFRMPSYALTMNPKPNLMRIILTHPFLKAIIPSWEDAAKIMIANFRADCVRYAQDQRFIELIEEFKGTSELFRNSWPHHDVKTVMSCHKLWMDPEMGELEFEQVTLQMANNVHLKIIIYTASPSTVKILKETLPIQ